MKEREHTFFAVFRKGVKIKELVVGGCRVNLEVASVNQNSERRMNGKRDTIDQAMRDLNGMNCERADFDAITGTDLIL